MTPEFTGFGKIPRLNRDCLISEKIDGTNAGIRVTESGGIVVQSRKRVITVHADNFGFAEWAYSHEQAIIDTLGVGMHFGEWWGAGIQRKYGRKDRQFSLFKVGVWRDVDLSHIPGLGVVPVLYEGPFDTDTVHDVVSDLAVNGSAAAPGFMDPEGVIVYHGAANSMFKVTCTDDAMPKSTIPKEHS